MKLENYQNEINAKLTILNKVNTIVYHSTESEDLLLAIKAVESLENINHLPIFETIVNNILAKINTIDMANMRGEDMTLLSRALKLKDMPMGSESRWKQLTQDDQNVDFHGDIVIGERTLESLDDKIMEDFYIN